MEGLAGAASNEVTTALQKGLFEEEANQNLPAAIEAYQTVIQKLDENRKLAATAIFRLGECYRKMGRTNEAAAQYQRVLREFSDQTLVQTLSEQNLGRLLPGEPSGVPSTTNQVAQLTFEALEIQRLQALMRDSPDLLNAPTEAGQTRLQKAAQAGQLATAEFLLEHGADPNVKSPRTGETALHMTALTGNKAMLDLLLKAGAQVNGRNNVGQTALHDVANRGFKAVAELLLKGGADVNAKTDAGETPLHEAAANGQLALAELLLANKAEVDPATTRGVTPLTKAVQGRHLSLVKLLLKHKADPNAGPTAAKQASSRSDYPTRTVRNPGRINYWQEDNYPVHLAVKLNAPAILEALLQAGANPNRLVYGSYSDQGRTVDMDGWTPLMIAIEDGRKELVQMLLKYKADPNLGAALFRALSNPDIAKLLLDHGADVNMTIGEGRTPLHQAVVSGQKELVQALLQKKPDVNAKDQNGFTPLQLAVGNLNDSELAEVLLAGGADPNARVATGETALHFAVQRQNLKIVELLLAAKADVNARNGQRKTPLGMISPTAPNGPPAVAEIADLLRRHGGLDDLPREDQIEIRRSSANYTNVVFVKGTNDLNRFTLFEAIAVQYGLIAQDQANVQRAHQLNQPLPTPGFPPTPVPVRTVRNRNIGFIAFNELGFPDFAKLKVLEPRPKGRPQEATEDIMFPDCSRDRLLAWGTVIEIPEADHPINAGWQGLVPEFVTNLQNCLQREVTLTIKGQSTNLLLRFHTNGPPAQFYLRTVLLDSGLIRTSSDLSQVKVKRQDRTTGGAYELIFDCSKPTEPGNSTPSPDLWLRDGDVIEVPDKP